MLSQRQHRLLRGLQHPRGRERHGLFIVEGPRLVAEALAAGGVLKEVFAVESGASIPVREVLASLGDRGFPVTSVTSEELCMATDTVTPQGIVATAEIPEVDPDTALGEGARTVLVVEGVQDPGNVGALLRCADAFACSPVVLLKGTADPYNPKTVRGSMGAHFHVRVVRGLEVEEAVSTLVRHAFRLVAAVPRGGQDHRTLPLGERQAILVGGEGGGLSRTLLENAAFRVTVSTPGRAESLNVVVAAGILLDRCRA